MKKPVCLMFMTVLVLACVSLIACGGGGEKKQEATAESTKEELAKEDIDAEEDVEATGEDMIEPGSGWDDVPIYANAKYDDSRVIKQPRRAAIDGGKSEVRSYTTKDDPAKVISFYKKQMSKKGWTMLVEHEEEKEGWGSAWQKKNGKIIANVSVIDNEEGGCDILLGRHTGQK